MLFNLIKETRKAKERVFGKFYSRDGMKQILFDTSKWNIKKLKCFELQMIGKTHQIHK